MTHNPGRQPHTPTAAPSCPPRAVPDPLTVLAEVEARAAHPTARRRPAPVDTAQAFHDEVDAQTSRVLPRRIPGPEVTACTIGVERQPLTRGEKRLLAVFGAVGTILVAFCVVVLSVGGAA